MSKRSASRMKRTLENRVAAHPAESPPKIPVGSVRQPGSQNPAKSFGRSHKHPRRRGG